MVVAQCEDSSHSKPQTDYSGCCKHRALCSRAGHARVKDDYRHQEDTDNV